MAAPMVTGAAALLYSGRPDLSLSDVRTALLSSVHKLAPLKGKTASGGMLDVAAAMKWGRYICLKKQPPGSRRINAPEAGRLFYFTYAVLSRHLHRVSLIFLISYSHVYLFLLCFSVLEELLGYSREQSVA